MKQRHLPRALVSFLGIVTLASCTSSPPSPTANAGYARYYFVAPHDTGVFEVTAKPPTVCYSTQSYPARPITLVDAPSGRAVASYGPLRVQHCDRKVTTELAALLISDPSAFIVKWSPQAGQPVVETRLTPPEQS